MESSGLVDSAAECDSIYENYANFSIPGNYCQPAWDIKWNICWPPTAFGEQISHLCTVFTAYNKSYFVPTKSTSNRNLIAFKTCLENGTWTKTDYNICYLNLGDLMLRSAKLISLGWLVIVCSIISLIALGISLFIFFYFKSLYCSRLRVHRNMCVALMLHLFTLFPFGLTKAFPLNFLQTIWIIKSLFILYAFSGTACCAWMFVEGLLLHSRVTVRIFERDAPFKLYYFIGWIIPLTLAVNWSVCMHYNSSKLRWSDYTECSCLWIVGAAQYAALGINTIFLVNVIRVLVTRRRNENTTDIIQLKKAVRATALLFPLLGIPHLLSPISNMFNTDVYMFLSHLLWLSQGLVFGVIYCFADSEVQKVVRNAYLRAAISRNPNRVRFNTSRAMSRTSNTYVPSNSNGTYQDSSVRKSHDIELNRQVSVTEKQTVVHVGKGSLTAKESLTML